MADFPAPQSASAPTASTAPVSAGLLAYALFGIAAVVEHRRARAAVDRAAADASSASSASSSAT